MRQITKADLIMLMETSYMMSYLDERGCRFYSREVIIKKLNDMLDMYMNGTKEDLQNFLVEQGLTQ